MNVEYALDLLKADRSRIAGKLVEMSLPEVKVDERKRTRYKRQIASLEFSIELLETYLD